MSSMPACSVAGFSADDLAAYMEGKIQVICNVAFDFESSAACNGTHGLGHLINLHGELLSSQVSCGPFQKGWKRPYVVSWQPTVFYI